MSVNLHLTQQQLQAIRLSPAFQQSLQVLHMSHIDLSAYLSEISAHNPLLEWNKKSIPATRSLSSFDFDRLHERVSLTDTLVSQINTSKVSSQIDRILRYMIGSLNDSGYLMDSLEEIASCLDEPMEIVVKALHHLQSFDPAGIGARSLQECLLLQLDFVPEAKRPLIKLLLNDHMELIAANEWAYLAELLHTSEESLLEAFRQIQKLQPRPALAYARQDPADYIIDITVKQIDGRFVPVLNQEAMIDLSITPLDNEHTILADKSAKSWYRKHLSEGLRLLSSLEKRSATMLCVASAIIERQQHFFAEGPKALRPLTLRDVARETSFSVSTVSRASQNKWMKTTWGIYPFSYFFPAAITAQHETRSSESIKAMLRSFVAYEDKRHPLSDEEICAQFKDKGIYVARRTIAKYRVALTIPSSRERKLANARKLHL